MNILLKSLFRLQGQIVSKSTNKYRFCILSNSSSIKYFSEMSERPSVYITRPDVAQIGIDILKDECEVSIWTQETTVPRDVLLKNVIGKHAIYCSLNDRIDKELLDHAGPNLKVVATISVGYDHIDVKECKERGIKIGYTPDVLTDATAELTIALLLATSRRLIASNKAVHNGDWKTWTPTFMCGPGLKDAVVGVIGFGRIGQEVAKRVVPFKPKQILYQNRSDKFDEAKQIGAERTTLSDLLKKSDFVILTCSLNDDTKHLFDETNLNKMKPNAILINTSRGGIVDQKALYKVLKEKRIYAAGLDVTTPEPLPLDSPLLELDNCVILPHIGSADINTRIEMSRITACNILAGLKGVKMISEL